MICFSSDAPTSIESFWSFKELYLSLYLFEFELNRLFIFPERWLVKQLFGCGSEQVLRDPTFVRRGIRRS